MAGLRMEGCGAGSRRRKKGRMGEGVNGEEKKSLI
jgi:hypothetical protein